MILLNDVVEIADRSTTEAPTEFSTILEFIDDRRVGRIPIYVDDSWTRMVR
jgi:hypothetical protein